MRYTGRKLIKTTDRISAIKGLEERIANKLGCTPQYGVFKSFLHSGLLWLVDNKTKKIDYKKTGSERAENVPSWSWMAYEGKIRFIPSESTKWFGGLEIHDQELCAEVALFRNGTRTGERTTEELMGKSVLDSVSGNWGILAIALHCYYMPPTTSSTRAMRCCKTWWMIFRRGRG